MYVCVFVSVFMSCVYLSVLRIYVILYLNEFLFANMCVVVCLVQYDYVSHPQTYEVCMYLCI